MVRQPMSKQRERVTKEFPVLVTGTDESQGIVEAIVAVMGNIDDGDDIIHKGAFTKTLSESWHRVRVLDQHKTDSILRALGQPLEAREVGRDELPPEIRQWYPNATGGLWTKTQFHMEEEEDRRYFNRIAKKSITEWSFAFDIINADYERVEVDGKKKTVRNLRELRLYEYSPVIWGMNPATATVSAKDAEDFNRAAEKLYAEAGRYLKHTEDEKELTPDGPQKRLGDMLIGGVHWTFIAKVSSFVEMGYISAEEYLALNAVATQLIDLIQNGVDEDILLRPYGSAGYYDTYWWEGEGASAAKTAEGAGETEEAESDGGDAVQETAEEADVAEPETEGEGDDHTAEDDGAEDTSDEEPLTAEDDDEQSLRDELLALEIDVEEAQIDMEVST